MEKEANNNHHRATEPLKGDGWSKDGEKGETEGDGGSCQSLAWSVLLMIRFFSSFFVCFLPVVY